MQQPVRELCFLKDVHRPSFAPFEDLGELKVGDAALQSSADWGNGTGDIGSPALCVK